MDMATVRAARTAALAVVALAGLILLGGCGGSGSAGDPGQTATASSSSPAQAGSSSGTSQSGAVAFAQCVRSHGVPGFPDPQNGHFLISGADQNNPNFSSAVQTCQHLLGPGGASNGGSNNSQLLAFAHCMQTHGVPKFPDPAPNGGIGLPAGVDPNSAQFQRAWRECQSNLPGNLQGQP